MKKETVKKVVIDLNTLTVAEKKMFEFGGFIAIHKLSSEEYSPKVKIEYAQCYFKQISVHEISISFENDFTTGRTITFDLKQKAVTTAFAYLNYKLLGAVMERCKELDWDTED